MAKKVIDESAIFSCQKGIGVTFKVNYPGQMIAQGNRKSYLNVNTKCSLLCPGQCTMQPNPSGAGYLPCNQAVIPSTSWNGADQVIKINGAKALTKDANTLCPLGGKITLQGICNTIFNAGCSATITEIIVNKTENNEKQTAKNSVNTESNNIKAETLENDAIHEGRHSNQKEDKKQESRDINENNKTISDKYANCAYENCTERDDCPYFNAKAGIDNNSFELKKNFEKDRPEENSNYMRKHNDARSEYPEYGWGYEGHHMISGNQVFMAIEKDTGNLKYGHLLKLANMCEYNINNGNNCILLPSIARNDSPWGTLETYEKEAKAFDVMDIMKRQWHLGGHAYTVPKDSLKYYKPTNEKVLSSGTNEYFPNYATSVQMRLDNINAKYARKKCWKKMDNEMFREKFRENMDKISKEIEDMLMKFEKNPKESYPYFVSKMSVDYAYDAPKTGKIILLYKKQENIFASKFRVSRKQKDNYQVIIVQNEEIPEMRIDTNNLITFIRYCENIMYFWIDKNLEKGLPWNCDKEIINYRAINGEDIYRYACDNSTEIFTFIDKNEITNQGQIAQIRKRWKEVKENAVFYG